VESLILSTLINTESGDVMKSRVRVFTYSSGTGSTVIENTLEDRINEWLKQVEGKILFVTQSESERKGTAHTTVSIWYEPAG
jgi:hypothetical protein